MEARRKRRIGLRQSSDRFSVITFSIFHQVDIEEFHFGKASELFIPRSKQKYPNNFPSIISDLDFGNKSKNQQRTKVGIFVGN